MIDQLLDTLLPRLCLGCEARVSSHQAGAALGLCTACLGRLRPVGGRPVCRTCALPLGGEPLPPEAFGGERWRGLCGICGICGICAMDPPPQAALFALWQYAPPLRELIHGLKFRRLDYLGSALGTVLGKELLARGFPSPGSPERPDALVPVPLAWTRRILRGYNQCEEIAGALARSLDLPVRRWLARAPFRRRQTSRKRAGRLLTGGFRATLLHRVEGQRILLIDDVYTTGATVRAASRALLEAGAAHVDAAVIGWTPPHQVGLGMIERHKNRS